MEEKIGPVAFKSMELEMKSFDDSLIPLMQEENALASRYSKLIASAKIMWEGEELNLSLMRKYMRSQDRNTRKKAWDAFSGFFEENQAELDEIYDLMVKNRTRQAQMLGFENYIDMGYFRMNRNSYTKEDVQKLREQIKTVFVPLASRMHKNRQHFVIMIWVFISHREIRRRSVLLRRFLRAAAKCTRRCLMRQGISST